MSVIVAPGIAALLGSVTEPVVSLKRSWEKTPAANPRTASKVMRRKLDLMSRLPVEFRPKRRLALGVAHTARVKKPKNEGFPKTNVKAIHASTPDLRQNLGKYYIKWLKITSAY